VTTIHEALGAAFIVLITAIFISMSMTFYLTHRLTEKLEAQLTNCKLINDNKKTYDKLGFIGKVFRFGTISLITVNPKSYARKGLVDIREIDQLPNHTKKLLSRLVITCLALFFALLAFRACLYFADHYKNL